MLGTGGSMQLARIFGIRIGASPSWFIVLFVMIYLLSGHFADVLDTDGTTSYVVAVAAAMLFFVSLVLHELGHALVARRAGIGIEGIDLWFFGGIARMARDTNSPGEEFRVAAAGPAVTLLIIAVCVGAGAAFWGVQDVVDAAQLANHAMGPAVALVGWLAVVNAVLFVFNLLPAFPIDGGRIARALAWRLTGDRNRATRASARVGQGFAYLLIGLGIFQAFSGDPAGGVWLAVLGWFLGQAARSAVVATEFSERLDGVTAADLMDAEPVAVPEASTALDTHDEYFLRYRLPWFPVVDGSGHVVGVLHGDSVQGAVAAGRPNVTAGELVSGAAEAQDASIDRDAPLESLLSSEPLRRLGALVVVDPEGRLCGVVTLDRVRRALVAARPSAVGPVG